MAVFIATTTSETVTHERTDPEYYLPEHTHVENTLKRLQTSPIGSLGKLSCSAFYPAATHLYENGDMPFLRCVDIVKYPVMTPEQPYAKIPSSFVKEYKSVRCLKAGDIVISKVGTPCYASLLNEKMPLCAMTRTVLGITELDEAKIDKYYFISFLRSHYGFSQLMRERELTIQYQLTLDRTRKIRIYLPEKKQQTEVADILKESLRLGNISKSLYTQAQQLLEKELGLDKLAFEKPVGYEANFSDIMDSSRTDAEHFFPAFDKLLSNLPSHISFSPLFKELTYCQRGKQPQYCDKGLKVINSKHVLENKISFENNRYAAPALIKSLEIKSGDVLVNGTGRGTIGRSAPYLEDTNAIPDNHVTILRTETFDPVFLSVFLNSKAGKLQVEKYQRGSSGQLELYPFDIKKFLVWEAPDSVQKDIRQLYDKAYAAEKESHHHLEIAKTRVEQLIEQAAEKS